MKVYSANDFTSAYYVGTTTELKLSMMMKLYLLDTVEF